MRTKSRPITGPFAPQKQKTGTYATLPTYMHIPAIGADPPCAQNHAP